MSKRLRKVVKRSVALALAAVMVVQSGAYAAEGKTTEPKKEFEYLEEATMPEEIQNADSFYVGTTSGDLQENSEVPYLLKIGRGGEAVSGASVTLRFSDTTASYGKDYTVSTHEEEKDEKQEASVPENNQSLLDIIKSNDVDSEEYADITDKNAMEEFWQKKAEELADDVEEQAKEEKDEKEKDEKESGDATGDFKTNPLAQAAETMTGLSSDRKAMTSSKQDMVGYLSDVSNYTSDLVPGATLTVDFAAGEKEKYVEIQPVDNKDSDGSRSFYVILSEPSEGMTNSSISESMFSIVDDEPEVDATVSFAKDAITAGDEEAEVVVEREGALTETVDVQMTAEAVTATAGADFSPVDANVTFPFGIKTRTLKIPVSNKTLTEDATFRLKLTAGSGAKPGKISETIVTIKAQESTKKLKKAGKTKIDGTKLKGYNGDLQEVKYAPNIINGWRIMEGCYGGADWRYHGEWHTEGHGAYGMRLKTPKGSGVRVHLKLSGGSGDTPMYIYDGFRLNWDKDSARSSWSESAIGYLNSTTGNWEELYESGDRPRFGNETKTFYFGTSVATKRVRVGSWNSKGETNYLHVRYVEPIYRPFQVRLKAPDGLKYLQSNGKYAEDKNSVGAELVNEVSNSTGRLGYAIAYSGDKMVIKSTVTNNISRLSGVKIWDSEQKKNTTVSSKYYSGFKKGDSQIQVTLDNNFCTDYKDYISYDSNGGRRLKGNITLQPVYETIDAKVKINQSDEEMADGSKVNGKLYVHGQEMKYGQTYTYHLGDHLVFSSKVEGSEYTATGVEIESYNTSTSKTEIPIYPYTQKNSTYELNLERTEYSVTPVYAENNNRIVVRVSEADMDKFKAEGMFDATFLKDHAEKQNGYYDIVVADTKDTTAGVSYSLVAAAKDGYVPVWKETNSANYYMDTAFNYTAKIRRTANIVYLYAGAEDSRYLSVKGQLYYENFTLNKKIAGEPILPANGGFVNAGSEVAFAGEDGGFQTEAFHPVKSITVNGKTVALGGKDRPLYLRAIIGAAGVSEAMNLCLSMTGKTAKVSNGTDQVDSYITDLGKLQIRTNSADAGGLTVSNVYVLNKGIVTNAVQMNGEMTTLAVTIPETETEKVKSVSFLIYDGTTNVEKKEIKAVKMGENWSASYQFQTKSEQGDYAEADRVYVQVTTEDSSIEVEDEVDIEEEQEISHVERRCSKRYNSFLKRWCYSYRDVIVTEKVKVKKQLTDEEKEALRTRVYPLVNTGLTLVREGEYGEPTTQNMDLGILETMDGLPLVNNFNGLLNLGPIMISVENRYGSKQEIIGTRIRAALDMDFEKTKKQSDNYGKGDDGVTYGSFFHKMDNLADSFKMAGKNATSASKHSWTADVDEKGNLDLKKAAYGAPQWNIHPFVGFFIDLTRVPKAKDLSDTEKETKLVIDGGGLFLGGKGSYKVAWYALLPVVLIPCYFGVSGNLSLMIDIGGTTRADQVDEEVSIDGYTAVSHNLTKELDFDFQLSAAGTAQVYVGVGICGTLGVRGGMQLDAKFLWYPSLTSYYDYFKSSTGLTLTLGFKVWVDLLLFTVPIPVYTFDDWEWGLNKQLSQLKKAGADDFDKLMKPKNASAATNNKTAAKETTEEVKTPIEYELKEMGEAPSEWNGEADTSYMTGLKKASKKFNVKKATYKETSNELISNGYDNPDAKLMDMGDEGTLLVFLQKDTARATQEQTAISYSVYQDGTYSDPVVIQTDGTADFQPSITEAGDDMLITWISSDPEKDKGNVTGSDYQKNYLNAQEVYTVRVPKADLAEHKEITQSDIVKLTNDEYYQSKPFAVYDKTSGDINVYWITAAEDDKVTGDGAEAVDFANPMNTGAKIYYHILYRVYDASEGKWLVDEYLESEKPSSISDAEYKAQLQELGGQRMVSSPITEDDLSMNDPLIADFTGISYNGIGVYAYTIDKDNNADTNEDRDLFIQCYDFEKRTNYVPIRITDDDVADSEPQIVRKGGETDGTTYLFYRSGDTLSYFDLTSLVKYGVDKDGKIKESALKEPDATLEENPEGVSDEENPEQTEETEYNFHIYQVTPYGEMENNHVAFNDYQVALDDKDNMYVVYVDGSDDNGEGQGTTQDIFATALIESKIKPTDGDTSADSSTRTDLAKIWSRSNQLTKSGGYVDSPALAVTSDSKMAIVYNSYDLVTVAGDEPTDEQKEAHITGEKVKLSDVSFKGGTLEAFGSVEATDITLSDTTPEAGEEVKVDVNYENTGLTAATDGFVAKAYLKKADGTKTLIDTFTYEDSLSQAATWLDSFTFEATDDMNDAVVVIETTEQDTLGYTTATSESFVQKPEYQVVSNKSYQGEDSKFYTEVVVKNVGNKATKEGDILKIFFAGPYLSAREFGVTNDVLASEDISLAPGEEKEFFFELNVPATAFEKYTRIRTEARVTDKDGNEYDDYISTDLFMYQPADLKIGDGKEISMKEGEEKPIDFTYVTTDRLAAITPMYVSDDPAVVSIENGKMKAMGAGTTTVHAYADPFDASADVQVTVEGKYSTDDIEPTATEAPAATEAPTATETPAVTPAVTKPGKPGTPAVKQTANTKVTVSWKEVSGAEGYQVEYSTSKSFKNAKTKSTTKTKLTLKGLKKKKTYYFRVRAYKKDGTSKVYGDYSTAKKCKLLTVPAKPKVKSVKNKTGKKAVITWNKVNGAKGYQVIYAENKKFKKAKKKSTTKKKLTVKKLKKGKTYYIKVRAYKKNGGKLYGKYSKVRKVKITK